MVAARHKGKRRTGSEAWRLQTDRPEENRGIAQALGGTKFAPQDRRLSLGAVDAVVLYQPCRQDAAEKPTRPAAARQDRAGAAVSSRVILSVVPAKAATQPATLIVT